MNCASRNGLLPLTPLPRFDGLAVCFMGVIPGR
jgi:hypothetical protein